jgi:hypothetical protein
MFESSDGMQWCDMGNEERGGRCAAERAMVRMMCGVKLRDRKSSNEFVLIYEAVKIEVVWTCDEKE